MNLIYVATAAPKDEEMKARIDDHIRRRGLRWRTIEETLAIADIIDQTAPGNAILVDCLTLWLTNLMLSERVIVEEVDALKITLAASRATVTLVSNEVGFGVVPDNAMARSFVDHAGRMHQDIATIADQVVFMAAGLPIVLKGPPLN